MQCDKKCNCIAFSEHWKLHLFMHSFVNAIIELNDTSFHIRKCTFLKVQRCGEEVQLHQVTFIFCKFFSALQFFNAFLEKWNDAAKDCIDIYLNFLSARRMHFCCTLETEKNFNFIFFYFQRNRNRSRFQLHDSPCTCYFFFLYTCT